MASEVQQLVEKNSNARGLVLIVTNDYKDSTSDDLKGKPLPGCHFDGEQMEETFMKSLKFACVWKKNCLSDEIKRLVEQVAECKFSGSYKFIVFAFSGHGNKNCVLGNNGRGVDIQQFIVDPLEPGNSATTCEITKMFFIDACRGKFKMSAENAKGDSPRIKRGRYLIAYATFIAYKAYMSSSKSGSKWMTPLARKLRSSENKSRTVQSILGEVLTALADDSDTNTYQCPMYKAACGDIFLYKDGAGPTPTLDSISPGGGGSPKDDSTGTRKEATDNRMLKKLQTIGFPDHLWKNLAKGLGLGGIILQISHNPMYRTNDEMLNAVIFEVVAKIAEPDRWKKLVDAVFATGQQQLAAKLASDPEVNVPCPTPAANQ